MRIKDLSINKKIPLKSTNLAINTEPISSSRSGIYNNFQKTKSNNTNNSMKKITLTEINLNSLGNLIQKSELREKDTFSNKTCSLGAYFVIERIFKFIKPKISQDLYNDLKIFLIEELRNFDENGEMINCNSNLHNSFNSITEIINMNFRNSRNTKRIETYNSNNNNPVKMINYEISSERRVSNDKTLILSPKLLPFKKVTGIKKENNTSNKNIMNKLTNHPSSATNKDYGGKMKFEVKTSLYNEFKTISKNKLKNNFNLNSKKNSAQQSTPLNNNLKQGTFNQSNTSDARVTNSKTSLSKIITNNNSNNNTGPDKAKSKIRIPNEISINLKDIGDVKIKDKPLNNKLNSVSMKNTNANSQQTTSNNNSIKIPIPTNINIGCNKDLLKEVKLNLDENLRPLLNFSYEHFFNKDSNESYSKQESSNEINSDPTCNDMKEC